MVNKLEPWMCDNQSSHRLALTKSCIAFSTWRIITVGRQKLIPLPSFELQPQPTTAQITVSCNAYNWSVIHQHGRQKYVGVAVTSIARGLLSFPACEHVWQWMSGRTCCDHCDVALTFLNHHFHNPGYTHEDVTSLLWINCFMEVGNLFGMTCESRSTCAVVQLRKGQVQIGRLYRSRSKENEAEELKSLQTILSFLISLLNLLRKLH